MQQKSEILSTPKADLKNIVDYKKNTFWDHPFTTAQKALAQVFSCEFCEIFGNTFFTEHLRTTASVRKQNFNVSVFDNFFVRTEYIILMATMLII